MNRNIPTALEPLDEHNERLMENVAPVDWQNPNSTQPYHLVVIGAGTGGLVTAAGAAGLGARVALIEQELMGGDCLNVGCVPSKSLISSARAFASQRNSSLIAEQNRTTVDFSSVMNRMRQQRAKIAPADSADRFKSLGVDVYFGRGSFLNESTIVVANQNGQNELSFRKAVIATGARASAPPIPGIESIETLTNETLFSLTRLPHRFAIIGSGPIGVEMAQTFCRFGSEVFLFERQDRILPREDLEASEILRRKISQEGVNIILNCVKMSLSQNENSKLITVEVEGNTHQFEADQILVAAGRKPNTEKLKLENASVNYDQTGIFVNDHLQTTNPRIFAVGDVCKGKLQFTHAADFMARMVIQNALFAIGPLGRKKFSQLVIPWATYTSPEIAHVGIQPNSSAELGFEIDTFTQHLDHVDRAILENEVDGFVRVHTKRGSDKIVGATIIAENAGDLISQFSVAMTNRLGLSDIGKSIFPYPTQAEAIRKLGDQYNKTKLTAFNQKLLALLRWMNVGS